MEEILHLLRNGAYPTMNGTRYVLAEFFSNASRNAIIYCLHRFLEAGYCPIMAHAERYRNLDLQTACALHEEGVLIQMNVYSVEEEAYTLIKNRVRSLLDNRLIDFAGSDAHGVGHRPPSYLPGIEYMYSHYDHAYVDAILEENPRSLLMA
jgi:protein-tyrosine phosphatase